MRLMLLAFFALPACGAADGGEKLCQANIKSKVIFAKTIDFIDFRPIDRGEAYTFFLDANLKANGYDADDVGARDSIRKVADATFSAIDAKGGEFRSYLIRAETLDGRKRPSALVCVVDASECSCFNADTIPRR